MANNKYILLSFDVEEFDLPLEYNQTISSDKQLAIGKKGLDALHPVLNNTNIRTTLFTTANFAVHFPDAVKKLAAQHEIASHTFYHSTFQNEDLLSSKQKLEEISGTKVTGLRMPRMKKVEMNELKKAGYEYDSSVNPTFIPGRYNNLKLPRNLYTEDDVKRLPTSVTPNFRIPLFWLAFKNFPYPLFKKLTKQTLNNDGYVCLYFHPWEFIADIAEFQLPGYVKKLCGVPLQERLYTLIKDFSGEGEYISMQDYLHIKSPA
jgi:peptidoglycan/xylan/chitin deacetylase (PgdA/CDA1 family)